MQQVVRLRGDCHEVTRQTGVTTVGAGEKKQTTETVYVDALLYAPNESSLMAQFGDRLQGDLNGLALPDETVEVGDEFAHDGETYEVSTVDDTPSGFDTQLQRFALERVTNERP